MEQHTDTPVVAEIRATAPAVVFDKVSFAFDDHVILREISFSVPTGSMSILLGASGAGKSILLRLIMGLLRPDEGSILVDGQRVDSDDGTRPSSPAGRHRHAVSGKRAVRFADRR